MMEILTINAKGKGKRLGDNNQNGGQKTCNLKMIASRRKKINNCNTIFLISLAFACFV